MKLQNVYRYFAEFIAPVAEPSEHKPLLLKVETHIFYLSDKCLIKVTHTAPFAQRTRPVLAARALSGAL